MLIAKKSSGIAVATSLFLGISMQPLAAANPVFPAAASRGTATPGLADPGRSFDGQVRDQQVSWFRVRMSDGDRLAQARGALHRGGSLQYTGSRPLHARQPAQGSTNTSSDTLSGTQRHTLNSTPGTLEFRGHPQETGR